MSGQVIKYIKGYRLTWEGTVTIISPNYCRCLNGEGVAAREHHIAECEDSGVQ